MLQVYVSNILAVSNVCCKCFIYMLHMLHWIYTYVASVCFKYFIYFRRMLQVFIWMMCMFQWLYTYVASVYSVSSVSDICYKCFIWILHILQLLYKYVASVCCKCFIYLSLRRILQQMLYVASVP